MLPQKLKKWDTIWIISPSWPISPETKIQLDNWINFFENLWFKVKLWENALKNTLKYSATPEEKAEDINTMFADREVQAIICSQWWANSNSILDLINYENIKNNPKIFLWISDITVLLNTIYKKTWLITFHWNDVMWWFWREYTDYDKQEFIKRLINGKIWEIKHNSERKCIRKWEAEWILVWGNTSCLNKLTWTQYFPDFENKMLFLEDYDESTEPDEFECDLHHLKQIWIFDKIKWLWLGYYNHPSKISYEEIVMNVLKNYDFPILKCDDFWHNTPNTTIPIWAKVKLDATNKKVTILENCVK